MIIATHGIVASQIQSFVGLLDLYPSAAAAYSLRKLRSAYTGSAIRVRRSSDNTEQDIGFTSVGDLDTSSLTSFCGSGNGFVTTWYDQSGNGLNVTQTTAANQPQIVSSGSILQMGGLSFSKSCIEFDGINDSLTILNSFANSYPLYVFCTTKATTSINRTTWYVGNTGNDNASMGGGANSLNSYSFKFDGSYTEAVVNNIFTNDKIGLSIAYYDNGSNTYYAYGNNSSSVSNSNTKPTVDNFTIGSLRRPSALYRASITNEIIVYPSDQSSNLSGIKTNINTYYGIY